MSPLPTRQQPPTNRAPAATHRRAAAGSTAAAAGLPSQRRAARPTPRRCSGRRPPACRSPATAAATSSSTCSGARAVDPDPDDRVDVAGQPEHRGGVLAAAGGAAVGARQRQPGPGAGRQLRQQAEQDRRLLLRGHRLDREQVGTRTRPAARAGPRGSPAAPGRRPRSRRCTPTRRRAPPRRGRPTRRPGDVRRPPARRSAAASRASVTLDLISAAASVRGDALRRRSPRRWPGSSRSSRPCAPARKNARCVARTSSGSSRSSRADHRSSDRSCPRCSSSVARPPSRTTTSAPSTGSVVVSGVMPARLRSRHGEPR